MVRWNSKPSVAGAIDGLGIRRTPKLDVAELWSGCVTQ